MNTKLCELRAKLVKHVAPEWCIKKGTRRSNPRACLYLLGEAKELEMIINMKLSDDEILEREWSYQTVKALLADGRHVFELIKTDEQMSAVRKDNYLRALEVFWKKKTPSKKQMVKLLEGLLGARVNA